MKIQDTHIFLGMRLDSAISKLQAQYLIDARNIRITAREDHTAFSIVNEKGPTFFTDVEGVYLGHCIINKYLVIFSLLSKISSSSHNAVVEDTITRYDFENQTSLILVKATKNLSNISSIESDIDKIVGGLNFNRKYPLETLGIFETDLIQKVYWVDGKNQPRVINIVKPELLGISSFDPTGNAVYKSTDEFNFVNKLDLLEFVTVEKIVSTSSVFMPGTMLYAITYYNKYGLETNIAWVSPVYYIGFLDRGGNPEERVSNAFKLHIENILNTMDYLRLYSIHRAAEDTSPAVHIVGDFLTNSIEDSIDITDDGMYDESVDPNYLQYVGGEELIAETLCLKDNTCFLGNITISRPSVPDIIKSKLRNTALTCYDANNKVRKDIEVLTSLTRDINSVIKELGLYYRYSSQLCYTETITKNNTEYKVLANPSTFKTGEEYRFGIQFQMDNGRWSEPVWIADQYISTLKSKRPSKTIATDGYATVKLPLLSYSFNFNSILSSLSPSSDDYKEVVSFKNRVKKIRGLVVTPYFSERTILALGMLCPTVFNYHYAVTHTPDRQSSWFLRPFPANMEVTDNSLFIEKGAAFLWKHKHSLYSFTNKGAEIQGVPEEWSDRDFNSFALEESIYAGDYDNGTNTIVVNDDKWGNLYFVDQSVVTMHSPDFEFDTLFFNIGTEDLRVSLVGEIPFNTSIGDISIVTDTASIAGEAGGFKHRTMGVSFDDRNVYADRSLASGLFYSDALVQDKSDTLFKLLEDQHDPFLFMVYPWHKSGSLNNDITRPADTGIRTSVLKEKKISNLKYSGDTYWFDEIVYGNDWSLDEPELLEDVEYTAKIVSYAAGPASGLNLVNATIPTTLNDIGVDSLYYAILPSYIGGPTPIDCQMALVPLRMVILNQSYRYAKKYSTHSFLIYGDEYDFYNIYIAVNIDYLDSRGYSREVRLIYKDNDQYIDISDPNDTEHKSSHEKYMIFSADGTYITNTHDSDFETLYMNGFGTSIIKSTDTGGDEDTDITNISFRTTGIKYFNEAQQSSIRLQSSNIDYNYYGNLDSLAVPSVPYGSIFAIPKLTNYLTGAFSLAGLWLEPNFNSLYLIAGLKGGFYNCDHMLVAATDNNSIGTNYPALRASNELISIKYKSSPHYVFGFTNNNLHKVANILRNRGNSPDPSINNLRNIDNAPFLFMSELYRDAPANPFGGHSEEDLQKNLWLPAGEAVDITSGNATVKFKYGDTWYQRYDCLKTFPYTMDDVNSVVEIGSYMCETRINIDGRYDRNRGETSNLFMSPLNFNLLNPVYSQRDNFFYYKILDKDFYKINTFPNQILWSLEKSPGELIDQWTKHTFGSYFNMDGDKGEITAIRNYNNDLYCFQEKAINRVLFNSRVQIPTSDGVPIEITNNYKLEGKTPVSDFVGCVNKYSICATPSRLYFIDSIEKHLYALGGEGMLDVSEERQMSLWFKRLKNYKWTPFDYSTKIFYDQYHQDLYIANENECLGFSEKLGEFISFYDYSKCPAMFNIYPDFYSLHTIDLASTRAGFATDKYDIMTKMFDGDYNSFYGEYKPYYITYVSNGISGESNYSQVDKIFNHIEMRADRWEDHIDGTLSTPGKKSWLPFNTVKIWNEFLDSGDVPLSWLNCKPSDMKKKFRVWRIQLPRDKTHKMDRIRNTWCKIKLSSESSDEHTDNAVIQLHDLVTMCYV